MEIICQYGIYPNGAYRVRVNLQTIPYNVKEVKFVGQHVNGKTNADVIGIGFVCCQHAKAPQGLTKIYPKLQGLKILNSNLSELTRADLVEYKNFKEFVFNCNQLEFLPGNLFQGFENLEWISFIGNQLKLVEPQILDGLNKLQVVSFMSNPNYNIFYDAAYSGNHEAGISTKQLRQKLLEKFRENKFNIQSSKAKSSKQNENAEKGVQELQGQMHSMTKINAEYSQELNRTIENLKCQLKASERKIQKLEADLKTKEVKVSRLGTDLMTKNTQIQQLKAEIHSLKTQLRDQKSSPTSALKTFVQQDHSFKDFRIKIVDREFLVHKLLLAARSPTLAKMLRNNPEADCLHLVDIPVGIFEQILDFLYTDKLPIGTGSSSGSDRGTNFVHLFAAAGRLKIEKLKNHAAVMIGEHIGAENALAVLKMSNKYGHAGLRMKAFEEIKRKYPKVEFKDEWMENYEKVNKIVEAFEEHEEGIRALQDKFKKMMKLD